MAQAPRDQNHIPALLGVSDADGTTPLPLQIDPATGRLKVSATMSGSFAPTDATYVTLSTNASLTNERVLTGTSNQVVITDNGAGSTVVLSLPQSIATSSTPSFASLSLTGASSLTLGTASSAAGALLFKNATNANTFTIQSGVSGSSFSWTLPTAQGAASTFLQNNGSGVLSWASAGTGDVTAASNLTDNAIVRGDGGAKGVQTSGVLISDSNILSPAVSDSAALGSGSLMWSDLFLAAGGVVNWNNGNLTLTHSTGLLSLSGSGGAILDVTSLADAGFNKALRIGTWDAFGYVSATNRLALGGYTAAQFDSLAIYTNAAERIRVDSSGNVGFGTTSPSALVHLYATGTSTTLGQLDTNLRLQTATATGNAGSEISFAGTGGTLGENIFAAVSGIVSANTAGAAGHLVFSTKATQGATTPTERMRITADGNVGIGTTTPLTNLQISTIGNFHVGSGAVSMGNNFYLDTVWKYTTTDFAAMTQYDTSGNIDFYVTASGTAGNAITWTQVGRFANTGGSFSSLTHTPLTSDGGALGTTALMWSDLFLASGSVINWNNGDVLLTHSANAIAITGGSLYNSAAIYSGTVGGEVGAVTYDGSAANTYNIIGLSGKALSLGSNGFYDRVTLDTSGNLTLSTSGGYLKLGGGATATELRLYEPSGSGTNYSAFKAQAQGADITYTLPATVGAAGTVLTDAAGNGTLSWGAAGGSMVVTAYPQDFASVSDRKSGPSTGGQYYLQFPDGSDVSCSATVQAPKGATSISSIKVFYVREAVGNVYLKFATAWVDVSAEVAITNDTSDSFTTYASGASDSTVSSFTVPSAAYNAFTVAEYDSVSILVDRDASSGSDTYNAAWKVVAVQFTFA